MNIEPKHLPLMRALYESAPVREQDMGEDGPEGTYTVSWEDIIQSYPATVEYLYDTVKIVMDAYEAQAASEAPPYVDETLLHTESAALNADDGPA